MTTTVSPSGFKKLVRCSRIGSHWALSSHPQPCTDSNYYSRSFILEASLSSVIRDNCYSQQKHTGVHMVDILVLQIIFPQIRVKSHWLKGLSFNLILPLIAWALGKDFNFQDPCSTFQKLKLDFTGEIKMTTRTFLISIPDLTTHSPRCVLQYPNTSSQFDWMVSYADSFILSFKSGCRAVC